ncbi:MAG: nucleotide sugar dehydrogenase [Caldilineaceae bacterium]|nr:nucleotide sugar dehydrogenase [Caldilineaceae bacterium]
MTSASFDQLINKINDRSAKVAVIGLGYVGLPLAVEFAQAGFYTVGLDLDVNKVNALNNGTSYVTDVASEDIASVISAGRFHVTDDPDVLSTCDAFSICVPTPLSKTNDPDLSYVISAVDSLAEYIHSGMLIVLESTTYPGTTEEIIAPRLLVRNQIIGKDIFVAFSPERIDPGRQDYTLKNTPKVIGGMTAACTDVASQLYGCIVEQVVPVTSPAAAEMAKLVENTYRSVNIALANELMIMCDKLGLDAWEVIDAAATKPFGFTKFTPGPGVGGHCIPLDPHYLAWKLRTLNYDARFIHLASQINSNMPHYWVDKVVETLNSIGKPVNGSSILILGVAYKRNIDDVRESPAQDIIELLRQREAIVRYHDPYVSQFSYKEEVLYSENDWEQSAKVADCILIVTDHSTYDWQKLSRISTQIVDTRHVIPSRMHGSQIN